MSPLSDDTRSDAPKRLLRRATGRRASALCSLVLVRTHFAWSIPVRRSWSIRLTYQARRHRGTSQPLHDRNELFLRAHGRRPFTSRSPLLALTDHARKRRVAARLDRHYFFAAAALSAGAGAPSAFHVSRTYSHFPPFFMETERYFPVSTTFPALSFAA